MSSYDKRPVVRISANAQLCYLGWYEIVHAITPLVARDSRFVVAIEVYPGIDLDRIIENLRTELRPGLIIQTEDAFLPPENLKRIFADTLSEDPVFNFMHPWSIDAYFDHERLTRIRQRIVAARGVVLVVGIGASRLADEANLLLSANLGRWEIQQRQRRHHIGNLGFDNAGASSSELYKTAFFLDWRVADRCRHEVYPSVDYFLDMTHEDQPAMLAGDVLRAAVYKTVRQPFRVVPFFDPGP